MAQSFEIAPFEDHHQPQIDEIMSSIADEFSENIFSSQFKKLNEIARLPTHIYWVAKSGGTVLGTCGYCLLENNKIELKRMFLHKDFRGQGVAQALVDTVMNAATDKNISTVYLGTMEQFKAAQAFYEKNGFTKIPREELPKDFLINPVDKVFYKREINGI
ncbi:MAG TPA: GNAT family N-acetyltransferase [Bacteroidia bacterium]